MPVRQSRAAPLTLPTRAPRPLGTVPSAWDTVVRLERPCHSRACWTVELFVQVTSVKQRSRRGEQVQARSLGKTDLRETGEPSLPETPGMPIFICFVTRLHKLPNEGSPRFGPSGREHVFEARPGRAWSQRAWPAATISGPLSPARPATRAASRPHALRSLAPRPGRSAGHGRPRGTAALASRLARPSRGRGSVWPRVWPGWDRPPRYSRQSGEPGGTQVTGGLERPHT